MGIALGHSKSEMARVSTSFPGPPPSSLVGPSLSAVEQGSSSLQLPHFARPKGQLRHIPAEAESGADFLERMQPEGRPALQEHALCLARTGHQRQLPGTQPPSQLQCPQAPPRSGFPGGRLGGKP